MIPPEAPGLGVELDEDVARAHPYSGDALHLARLTSRSVECAARVIASEAKQARLFENVGQLERRGAAETWMASLRSP